MTRGIWRATGGWCIVYCPVRRIGKPGEPDALSSYGLSVTFMAASPDSNLKTDRPPLRFEEEERAIFQAKGNLGMDLVVEESGTLKILAKTLLLEKEPSVLHISCHGSIKDKGPVLVLETDEGESDYVGPDRFGQAFKKIRPRLLFVSACRTGEAGEEFLNSYCSSLVQRGWPAALGWSGSVGDVDATRFAEGLYRSLSRKSSLEASVAQARWDLLTPVKDQKATKPSQDWHLARLYLGCKGGGPVCGGETSRRSGLADEGVKEFLDKKQQIPVAGRWEFVGRRRDIQKVLRVFQNNEYAGVLVHGMGRLGNPAWLLGLPLGCTSGMDTMQPWYLAAMTPGRCWPPLPRHGQWNR